MQKFYTLSSTDLAKQTFYTLCQPRPPVEKNQHISVNKRHDGANYVHSLLTTDNKTVLFR